MAFLNRITQSKLRHLSQHSKTLPYAALLNPTVSHSKACVSDTPYLIPHSRPTDFGSKVRFFAAPVQATPKKVEPSTYVPRMNEKIDAEVVRLVMEEGNHFIVSRHEALERARKLELDLVEVQGSGNPAVCKIMDYHKEKYKKEIREKENIKTKSDKTLRSDSKEVKFSPKTEAKDLKMKADMVKRFMDKGYRVKCTATDAEGKDLGALFSRLTALIEDVALVECEPTPGRGKEAYIMVRHVRFGPSKKGGGKKLKTGENTSHDDQNTGSVDGNGVTSHTADIQMPRRPSQLDNRLPVTPARSHPRPPPLPLPPLESSDGTQNRYRNNQSRNPFPPLTNGMDNRGPGMRDRHIPHQRGGTPTDLHLSPSMREPRHAEANAPVFRSSMHPRDFPKQEPSSPSPPRSPGLGYGVFTGRQGNPPPRHGAPPNSNSPSSRPDSSQGPGTGQGGFGIFGRESSSDNRTYKPN